MLMAGTFITFPLMNFGAPRMDVDLTILDDDKPVANAAEEADQKIVAEALALYKTDKAHWDEIYDKARDDLDFLSDEDGAQWDQKEWAARRTSGKPTITTDQLSQFVHQVANNIRMNTPSINPIPAGGKSSVETAKVLKGLIRKIEYVSCADEVYDTAATSAIKCSIGFALVDHDFTDMNDDDPFEQQFLIKRVVNPFMIYMDCMTIESDGRDQNHANVLEKMKVSTFRKENPEAEVSSFGDERNTERAFQDEDEVTITQFYRKEVADEEVTGTNSAGEEVKRTKKKTTIMRYKISGTQILSRTRFPGDYIPVVPFYGEEAWNDGKRNLFSLIRKAKGAQQMFNYMQSTEAEILLKQPIAPVMVPGGAIENYIDDWTNPSKSMALRYDMFDAQDRPLLKPERLLPPQSSSGFVLAAQEAVNNIKSTMGMYNNSLGQQSQEVSGKAIDARKIQGDVATYHFGDNAVRSITQIGRIIVCGSKEIYDTPRVVQTIDEENNPQQVGINGERVEGQEEDHSFDSKYDVRVITGNSYATRRQATAAFFGDLFTRSPDMIAIMGDIGFENMDFEGAQAAAERLGKYIDMKTPGLRSKEGEEQEVDPEKEQMKQIIQQGAQAIEALQNANDDLTKQVQDKNAAIMSKEKIEMAKIDQNGQKNQVDAIYKLGTLATNSEKNEITEENNAAQIALASQGIDVDALMQLISHIVQAQSADMSSEQELPPGAVAPTNDGGVLSGEEQNV